ncbi:MAG TPA: gamma-glutamyltransferase family protein, partial [Steroidobacteraceae bacterium]
MTLARSRYGVVTAPHVLASEAGVAVLAHGGNAIEAAIAIGATLAVVQPHMNGIGGDAFWLICDEDGIRGLDGAGPAGRAYSPIVYAERSGGKIPTRGPLAANTVAGVVSTWGSAFGYSRAHWNGKFEWDALLEPARQHAASGFPPGAQLREELIAKLPELSQNERFVEQFAPLATMAPRALFKQPALAESFALLQRDGAESFYRGALARRIVEGLRESGSLLQEGDLAGFNSRWVEPLRVPFLNGEACNLPPPTQGLASLIILALSERLDVASLDPFGADYIHRLVEATKQAFSIRERVVADPDCVPVSLDELLSTAFLDDLAQRVDLHHASAPHYAARTGDTVWFGAMDQWGHAVSVIQSLYFEFGSGVVAGDTGILWQNRGSSFSLDERHVNALQPGKRPLHTLNPAMYFENGRPCLVYGTMGGDGQPQTQAAVATRVLLFDLPLDEAIASPRWLFGKTWGQDSTTLKLESRFPATVFSELAERGHVVERVAPYSQLMG